MKSREIVSRTVVYCSDLYPEIETESRAYADVIEWADARPVIWQIVRGTKSDAFGRNSSEYMGCDRGDTPQAALARANRLKDVLETGARGSKTSEFWRWRANFTVEHYGDKGFTGGLFQQHDGTYDRGACRLDYTPKTLKEVVDRFMQWCTDGPCRFPTVLVKVDGKVVWRP